MINFRESKYSDKARSFCSKKPIDFRFFTLLDGSVRSTKSVNQILKIVHSLYYNGHKGTSLISGYSKQTVKNNILDELFNFIDYCRGSHYYNSSSGELKLRLGNKKYDLLVTGAGKIDSEKAIRGATFVNWFPDEMTLHHYSFVKQAFNRLSIDGARIFGTTNPDTPNHWLYTDYLKPYAEEDADIRDIMEYWHFTLNDNANLSPTYIQTISKTYKGAFYDRMIKGLWVVADGLVYDTFNEDKHVIPHVLFTGLQVDNLNEDPKTVIKMIQEREFVEYIGGVDWGWTHPLGACIIGVTRRGKYCLIDCLKKMHIDATDVNKWFKDKQSEYGFYIRDINGDCARPEQNDALRQLGWIVHEYKPLVVDRTSLTRRLVNQDRLFVSDRCQDYLNEIYCYRYPNKDERMRLAQDQWDKPIQQNNDVLDSVEYAIANYEDRFGHQFVRFYL